MRENKEKWMELCEQAANEQDPKKLMELVEQIDALLRTKQERLKKPLESAVPPSSQRDCQPGRERRGHIRRTLSARNCFDREIYNRTVGVNLSCKQFRAT